MLRLLLPGTIFAFGGVLSVPLTTFGGLSLLRALTSYSGPAKSASAFYRLLGSLHSAAVSLYTLSSTFDDKDYGVR